MRKQFLRSILLVSVSLLVLSSTPTSANAKNHKPTLAQIETAKKAEGEKKRRAESANRKLATAKGTLQQLTAVAEVAQARHVAAQIVLSISIKAAIAATARANVASASVNEKHREIGKLAINAYIMGGGLTDIESVLNAEGPQEIVDQLSILDNLGSGNKTLLERFMFAEQVAKSAKAAAAKAKRLQQVAAEKVSATKKDADAAKDAQGEEVTRLQAVQDELLRELASAKRVRITLEQRRQLALLEEAQAKKASQTKGQSKIWKGDGTSGRLTIRTNEAQRIKAVEFAKKQVLANKPYVWGSEGPNSFDCSGLVYAAYKSAGLGWPNWDRLNASLYYSYTKHIPRSQIQPGDLLFYSYDGSSRNIHHMSIYAGNGMAWEARSTRSGLRYSSIYSVEGMMPFAGRV